MKYSGTTRTLSVVLAAIAAMSTMTSCDSKSDGGKQASATVAAEERPKEMTVAEKYEAAFQSVLDGTNSWSVYLGELGKLEDEVLQMPNDEGLQMMERFIDMAIAAQPPPVGHADPWYRYNRRGAWCDKMYWVFQSVFFASRDRQKDPYEGWDKLFVFLGKYTNEIASLERSLRTKESRVTRSYMNDLKDRFGIIVNQFGKRNIRLRTDDLATIVKVPPTEERRTALLGRFEEFKKYTDYKSTRAPYTFSIPPYKVEPPPAKPLDRSKLPYKWLVH